MTLTLVPTAHQLSLSTVFPPGLWTKPPSGSSEIYLLLGTGPSIYATLMRCLAPGVTSGEQSEEFISKGQAATALGDSLEPFFPSQHTKKTLYHRKYVTMFLNGGEHFLFNIVR